MRLRFVLSAAALLLGRAALAQTAAEHIAAGDKEHAALNLNAALKHYEEAIAVDPKNTDALDKAAYDAVDLGEFAPAAERAALYRKAQDYAERAVAANPASAEAHFELARAIGRNAQTMGSRDKVKYAKVVRQHALEALKLDPKHAGALHVMGVWNAEIMRLSGFTRMIARNFLGGAVFGEASWDRAQQYLEESVKYDPDRITHHLDLGRVYADRHMGAKAREQFEWIARAPILEYNDRHYKEEAAQALKSVVAN